MNKRPNDSKLNKRLDNALGARSNDILGERSNDTKLNERTKQYEYYREQLLTFPKT